MSVFVPTGNLIFDLVQGDEIDAAYAIEREAYPSDEAASLEALRYRQANAPQLFLGAFQPSSSSPSTPSINRTLIGYVVSTLSTSPTLTHASMSKHEPSGTSVCIHSVTVAPLFRRRGIATRLLKEYVRRLSSDSAANEGITRPIIERFLLISHEELRGLYEGAGFTWVGKSEVQHGSRDWFEMKLEVPSLIASAATQTHGASEEEVEAPPPPAQPAYSQEAILAALSAPRNVPSMAAQRWDGVSAIPTGLVLEDGETKKNEKKLVCLRCSSVILLGRTCVLEEAPSVSLEPPSHPPPAPLSAIPTSSNQLTSWWFAKGSPMVFENVSFSRPVQLRSTSGPSSNAGLDANTQLLSCGECELGPVGYARKSTQGGGNEYRVHVSRVGYL